MDCIRCGGCCKTLPCWFAQINYRIDEHNKKPCPALQRNGDGTYTCLRMATDENMRHEFIGTGAFAPNIGRSA